MNYSRRNSRIMEPSRSHLLLFENVMSRYDQSALLAPFLLVQHFYFLYARPHTFSGKIHRIGVLRVVKRAVRV